MMLKATVEAQEGAARVQVAGRLDVNTSRQFEREMLLALKADVAEVILDLAALVYISLAGVRAVYQLRTYLAERGALLVVVNAQPQIRKVFDLVQAAPFGEVFTSAIEADMYLDIMQRRTLEE